MPWTRAHGFYWVFILALFSSNDTFITLFRQRRKGSDLETITLHLLCQPRPAPGETSQYKRKASFAEASIIPDLVLMLHPRRQKSTRKITN